MFGKRFVSFLQMFKLGGPGVTPPNTEKVVLLPMFSLFILAFWIATDRTSVFSFKISNTQKFIWKTAASITTQPAIDCLHLLAGIIRLNEGYSTSAKNEVFDQV